MRLLRASATVLALAAAVAAEPAPAATAPPARPAREYTALATRMITVPVEARLVAKAVLYVTEDGGRSWRLAEEKAGDGVNAPAFSFTAPRDGVFGFVTVVTRRDGAAESEPLPGTAPRLELVVDRAAPGLVLLEPTLGSAADGAATVAVSWQVEDPNLGADPVSVELSVDQGRTFKAAHAGAAKGTTALTAAVDAAATELQVRVVARDLAGNVLTSPARSVPLPAMPRRADPEAALKAAIAALPAPAELGTGRSGPIVSADGTSPIAEPAVAAPEPAPASPEAAPQPPAGAAQPPAGAAQPPIPEPDVVSGRDVEARYAREAGSPTESPRGRQPDGEEPAAVAAPPAERTFAPDPAVPYLVGAAAEAVLEQARHAALGGDTEIALATYLRLHRSSVAKTALAEQLGLLRGLGDHRTIIGIAGAVPPELRTDAVRLHAARAQLALGDAAASAAWAAGVRAGAEEAREAMLVLAKALAAQGRPADARRILDQLATGDDAVAAQARALQ